MSCKLESTIWSCDTGQWIPCLDRFQLIITWMSKKYTVNQGYMSLSTHYLEYGHHVVQLRRRRHRHRRQAYAPTSNTASHDNHEKINSWLSFCFPYQYGAPLSSPLGRQSSAMKRSNQTKNTSTHLFTHLFIYDHLTCCINNIDVLET